MPTRGAAPRKLGGDESECREDAIDLFSGIGGFAVLMEMCNARCVRYCDYDADAVSVLESLMSEGRLPKAEIEPDIRAFTVQNRAAVVTGGFPCQDVSMAGRRLGLTEGTRSALVWDMVRVAEQAHARWMFMENVSGLRTNGLAELRERLHALGWETRCVTALASELDAPHTRRRIFILSRKRDATAAHHLFVPPMPSRFDYGGEPARTVARGNKAPGLPRASRIRLLGNSMCVPQACLALHKLLAADSRGGSTWEDAWTASLPFVDRFEIEAPRKALCPTPLANDGKGGSCCSKSSSRGIHLSLSRWVRPRSSKATWGMICSWEEYQGRERNGSLNPEWVEWLMSFPVGWTQG